MTAGAIITMLIGMLFIWGGLAATILYAMRTESRWDDDE